MREKHLKICRKIKEKIIKSGHADRVKKNIPYIAKTLKLPQPIDRIENAHKLTEIKESMNKNEIKITSCVIHEEGNTNYLKVRFKGKNKDIFVFLKGKSAIESSHGPFNTYFLEKNKCANQTLFTQKKFLKKIGKNRHLQDSKY